MTSDQASPDRDAAKAEAALDKPIQDHLGRQLRSAYNEVAEKPAYLGDTALPPNLEHAVSQLRKSSPPDAQEALEAVRRALDVPLCEDSSEKPRADRD